jgi:lantibiotic leader peptide-processing serine protease
MHVSSLLRCAAGAVFLLLSACHADTPSEPQVPSDLYFSRTGQPMQAKPANHFLVEFTAARDLQAAVTAVGGRINRSIAAIGVAKVSGLNDRSAAALERKPGIVRVTRDLELQWVPQPTSRLLRADALQPGAMSPTDPAAAAFFPFQWNLRQIQADLAWATGFRGQGVEVAIIDTGIDDTHLDLIGKVDHAKSIAFVVNENPAPAPPWGDDNLHGTHVGSVVSSNGFGTASVAPNVSLIAVKVLGKTGGGNFGDVIAGIVYAADIGADILNLSLGVVAPRGNTGVGRLNAVLAKAVNYARSKGTLVVCASGNDGLDLDHSGNLISIPAQSGSAMAVSATGPLNQTNFDLLASFSDFGRSAVSVAAPGGNFTDSIMNPSDWILEPCSRQTLDPDFAICRTGNFYLFAAGTSAAAPHVSGVAALIEGKASGVLGAGQLQTQIQQTADDLGKPGADLLYSHGRVNAFRAVTE